MKATDVTGISSMNEYCSQGMDQEAESRAPDFFNEIKGLTTLQEIDLGDSCIAKQVHTYEAEVFWILLRDKKLVHISTDFDRLKDVLYSLRRVKFQPTTHSFLKTKHEIKEETRKSRNQTAENIQL